MLIDEVEKIILKAGNGGNGRASFYKYRRGPDGGSGGNGGNLYAIAISELTALNKFTIKKSFFAEKGENGKANQSRGQDGKDLEVAFPIGTVLTDLETGEEIEMATVGQKFLLCRGGKSGKGNYELRSSINTTPKTAQKGALGEKREFKVIMRLIADFGLVGLPNAGKSSLLNALTRAHAKVAAYPFTTLEPNLGTLENGKVIADIPGLIEGAARGKGLGIRFLKHIEKVKLILHCISCESSDLLKDYKIVRNELKNFNSKLIKKKEIILLTKTDLLSEEKVKELISILKKLRKKTFPISIHRLSSINSLKTMLF